MYALPGFQCAQISHNIDKLGWNLRAYNAFVGGQDGHNADYEQSLHNLYPPLDDIRESGPAMVVDKREVAALYFVPDALQSHRQVTAKAPPKEDVLTPYRLIFL